MAYDSRWNAMAEVWIRDSELNLSRAAVDRYVPKLAQQLHDTAEQFVSDEIPDLERDAEDAARDRHNNRLLDELKGK